MKTKRDFFSLTENPPHNRAHSSSNYYMYKKMVTKKFSQSIFFFHIFLVILIGYVCIHFLLVPNKNISIYILNKYYIMNIRAYVAAARLGEGKNNIYFSFSKKFITLCTRFFFFACKCGMLFVTQK